MNDLNTWKRPDLIPEVAAILAPPPPVLDTSAIMQLRSYLHTSDESAPDNTPQGFNSQLVEVLVLLSLIPIGLIARKMMGNQQSPKN